MIITFWKGVFVADSQPEDRVVLERAGFAVRAIHLNRGKCQFCQQVIPGVWDGLLHL